MQDKYVVERHWHYSNSRIGSGGFMPQLYYHVLAATLYLRCWHPRFEEICVYFGWVPRCVTMYFVVATPEPSHWPVLTRLTSDTGKFSYVVLRYVLLPPRCSLVVATSSYAVLRRCHTTASCQFCGIQTKWHQVDFGSQSRTFLHVSAAPQPRCTTPCYAIVMLAVRCCYVIVPCGKRIWILNMFKIQIR